MVEKKPVPALVGPGANRGGEEACIWMHGTFLMVRDSLATESCMSLSVNML